MCFALIVSQSVSQSTSHDLDVVAAHVAHRARLPTNPNPTRASRSAAASAAERNWSVYGQIQGSNKSRLAHRTADKLVFCHESMHVQLRMQDAGWSADLGRWESDEDSEDSDQERDGDEGVSSLSEATILRLMA